MSPPSPPIQTSPLLNGKKSEHFEIPSKERKIIRIIAPQPIESVAVEGIQQPQSPNCTWKQQVDRKAMVPSAPGLGKDSHRSTANGQPRSLSVERTRLPSPHNQIAIESTDSSLDIFSPVYIPLWLRAVNDSPASLQPCVPFPSQDIASYLATFAGPDFVQCVSPHSIPPPIYTSEVGSEPSPQCYSSYWLSRLQNEFALQQLQYQTYALYNRQVWPVAGKPGYFELTVPGMKEHSPRIDLGDMVHVRLLGQTNDLTEAEYKRWETHSKYSGALCPGFTGLLYDPHVWQIDRTKEIISLRMDGLVRACNVNVIFLLQESKLEPICRAVDRAAVGSSWLRKMLFPQINDGIPQKALSQAFFDIGWYDELNWEQKKSVHSVVTANYGTMPYLISGPPGTGKTKTLVEIAMQLILKPGHLLICAPSDAAADTLALRLSVHLRPHEMLRLNGWTRTFAEVPDRLMLYTESNETSFIIPPVEQILAYRIVVTTCRDADLLNQARLNNTSLANLFNGVSRLVNPAAVRHPLHWTALLLDEAAQATEPDTLIPLTVIMPPNDYEHPHFIAAGDQYQLGPKLVSKSSLNTSLFQRLFDREPYNDHPQSRRFGTKAVTASMLPMMRPAFTNLIRNYRSHPAILSVPSSLFYNDTLIPERRTSKDILSWPGWPSQLSWPVMFQQCDGLDVYESVTAGDGTGAGALYNPSEAMEAVNIVQSLLRHVDEQCQVPLLQTQVMVMSPFRAQVSHLRKAFRRHRLYDVNIGPLEAFQGLESRIVIICTTRTRVGNKRQHAAHHVQVDKARGLGIIDEPQRFNVALTRAKEGLIVIGNAACLTSTQDNQWISFLDFCRRNDCYNSGENFEWPDLGNTHARGRLERALLYATRGKEDVHNNATTQSDSQRKSNGTSQFRLKGTQQGMDEEMWQFKEMAMLHDSENVDLVFDADEEVIEQEIDPQSQAQGIDGPLRDGYDRNIRQEFQSECNTQ